MDSNLLSKMLGAILENRYDIDSVLVVRNGYLVTDAYVFPFKQGEKHIVYSCTKSVVSALIGIAIDQGYIAGVDQPLLDLFPERTVANLDQRKQAMTLEHVLTMSTGLDCQDSYLYQWRGLDQMWQSKDWVQFVLDLPMVAKPGTRFEYCNGESSVLSALVQETTGRTALDFAQEHLFGPLGISDVSWRANPQGITIGYSELHLTPHDMAKFGYLYLNGGQWEGKPVVSAEWVKASTRKHIDALTLEEGYGYQWWVDSRHGYYLALGYRGQFIFVVPAKNLVVVFTSSLEDQDFGVPQGLLDNYIIPAAVAAKPLPENPDGLALLAEYTEVLGRDRAPE
ncbi:MAG: serine hydrolase [Anaerolineae bacterium]|nr:serine hydrolase [Anaerolineae bacterium]